jgi:DNA repair protein RadA/Sms
MKKQRSVFFCNECGYESQKWLGKCPGCENWNTFIEESVQDEAKTVPKKGYAGSKPLDEVEADSRDRESTNIGEIDRVLGGGIVTGSLILIGGEPGIGKSTILLQIAANMKNKRILYVSGEESFMQIKLRAKRLKASGANIFMLAETDLDTIEKCVGHDRPDIVMIDSIQTMYSDDLTSAPGTISQVREVTARLMRITKETGITVIIVGHVTKEGTLAGPRVLEHMVDTVLYFEGERHMSYRILRAVKNRFGSTNEIGVFEMCENGLREISNPSEVMLSGRPTDASGSAVVATVEGTRPMLIEIQALMADTNLVMPRRTANGVDSNRISLLIAVLDKRVGLRISSMDAYINVLGGLHINEPACDLGIVCAIASSFKDRTIDHKTVVLGEVGLTGELRKISHMEKRINEAARMGFDKCVIPSGNLPVSEKIKGIEIHEFKNVREVFDYLF